MLTYEEAKDSHEAQINALLAHDWKTINTIFTEVSNFTGKIDSQHECWSLTGKNEHSLFANLPFSEGCLTQIKRYPAEDYEGWIHKLDIIGNNLIPTNVEEDAVFTKLELMEFSRLQLQARYPEETA